MMKSPEDFRETLELLAERLRSDMVTTTDEARRATGHGAGELTNAPQHLGDAGTDELLHDLNAMLLENQEHLAEEVQAARRRLDAGTFGRCENCGEHIPLERLQVIPYTRYCVQCSEQMDIASLANLNAGRPSSPHDTLAGNLPGAEQTIEADLLPLGNGEETVPAEVGTAGGGTALGGLAGTTQGRGDPDDKTLNRATASSRFDADDDRATTRITRSRTRR